MLRKQDIGKAIFSTLALGFFGLFLIWPLGSLLWRSFVINGEFSLGYFRLIFTTPGTADMFMNSVNLALAAVLISSVIAVPLALFSFRWDFPFKKILQLLIVTPMILPPFVGALGIRRFLARFGPVNLLLMDYGIITEPFDFLGQAGLIGIAFTEALHLFPIIYLNFSAALTRLDVSLEQAAEVCGATPWKRFLRITLPLVSPGYMAGASLVFIWSFTDLGTPLVFNFTDVVPVRVFNQVDEMHTNPAAYALVATLLIFASVVFMLARVTGRDLAGKDTGRGAQKQVVRKAGPALGLLMSLFTGFIFFMALFPHFGVLLYAVADKWVMSILPQKFTLAHFGQVFIHPLTRQSIVNSLLLSFGSMVLCVIIGTGIGRIISREKSFLSQVFDTLSVLPLAVPGIVVAFAYLGTFSGTVLDPRINPMWLLVFGYTIRRVPFIIRSVSAGFEQCSVTLEEAAQNAGATPFKVLRRITLPLVLPHILAGAILCFAFAMLEVSESLLLAMDERFYPLSKAMYSLIGRPDGPYVASAMGVLSMLIIGACLAVAGRLAGGKVVSGQGRL